MKLRNNSIVNALIVKSYNFIISRRIINLNNKLCRRMREILYHNVCYEGYARMGSLNKDKVLYVIRCPQVDMGLWGLINYVFFHIKKADLLGALPVVDWKYYPNKYLTEDKDLGKKNMWDIFFEQPCQISLEEAYRSNSVLMSSGDWIPDLTEAYNLEQIEESHILFKSYIRLNKEMCEKIEKKYASLGLENKRVLGLKCRGTDFFMTKPQGHAICPELQLIVDTIEEKEKEWGHFESIFLSTEDKNIFEYLCKKYNDRIKFIDTNRIELKEKKWVGDLYDSKTCDRNKKKEMQDYLIETYLLARCDSLIAPLVGGTLGALRISEGYTNCYIFNLGLYE